MLKDPEAGDLAPLEAVPVTRRPGRRGGMLLVGLAIVAALLGGLIYNGMRERAAAEAALATETGQAAAPFVEVVHPVGNAPDQTLVLPGQTMAFIDTPIYARASGYLKSWNYDIGAHVKRGDVLAQIETPELDQQLREAQAQLAQMQAAVTQAEANMDLAKLTSGRTSELVRQGWNSKQQGDQDRLTYAGSTAAVDVARANVRVAQAQVDRLEELTGFESVAAPFDGVITARNTDVGALINAGAGSPATELFHMASTRTLRIFVAVPETDAPDLRPGASATVTFDEYPGRCSKARSRAPTAQSTPPPARCWSRWTWTTPMASCCPGPTRSCISRSWGGPTQWLFRPIRCCSVARGCASAWCATALRSWCRSRSAATTATASRC